MPSISDINGSNISSLSNLVKQKMPIDVGSGNFSELLSSAMSGIQETDAADKAADMQLLSGDITDLHTAVIEGQKAELTLRLTTQMRNKVVDAYNEIMRMQV